MLWQAVQDRLRVNLQGQCTRTAAVNPSLLTGLLFDAQGHRLTPTHAKKGERRYRYYVGQTAPVTEGDDAVQALRIPAQELEEAVLQAVAEFLKDESCLAAVMGMVEVDEARSRVRHAMGLAEQSFEVPLEARRNYPGSPS